MIEIMLNSWPSIHVWSAVDGRPMPTISDLYKAGRSAARSVMNSRFRYAVDTIARFTDAAMKRCGGARQASMRPMQPACCGLKATRCRRAPNRLRPKHDYLARRILRIGVIWKNIRANLQRPARMED